MVRIPRWSILWPAGLALAATALALLASAAVPTQAPNRIAANEAAAIEALRMIAAAQNRLKAAVDVDTDCDGVGEYGYLAELAGTQPMRVCADGGKPAAGTLADILNPPLLRGEFGALRNSSASYRGYLFVMWLPSQTWGGRVSGVLEDYYGGKLGAPFPDPSNGAQMWCCYAWPMRYDHTGKRAFFINQRGEVLEYSNRRVHPWSGWDWHYYVPYFDEAYSVPDDMSSPLRIGVPNANGSVWWPVQ
jgi:hypothetical protein